MILYGIPNCDTVRKARKFLETNNVEFTFHDFRKDGLTLESIQAWLDKQPLEAVVNKRSTGWRQLDDSQKQQLMAGDALELLIEIPTLIKRPVLQTENTVLLGFKAEDYESVI